MIAEYTLSIDPKYAENGEELGIFEIANTATPAIKLKGIAFSSNETKRVYFADDIKYRIAAPVIIPGKVYRKDEETEEEYNAIVTTEYIESIYVDFMEKRMGGQVFNEEHDESKKPPSYILETWLVEDPKTDKSKTVYGLDIPKGSWFAVQQFTDKAVYSDYVKRGLTGFSIHGHSAMLLMATQNKTEMSNKKTELNEKPSAFIGLPVGETTVGDTVYTVEAVTKNAGEESEYTYNEIVSMVPVGGGTELEEDTKEEETEMAEDKEDETKKEETEMNEDEKEKDVEMVDDEKKEEETELAEDEKKPEAEEEEKETELADDMPGEYYSKEELDAKFAEVFDMIADMKKGEEVEEEIEDTPSVQMSAHDTKIQVMRKKLSAFGKFTGEKTA